MGNPKSSEIFPHSFYGVDYETIKLNSSPYRPVVQNPQLAQQVAVLLKYVGDAFRLLRLEAYLNVQIIVLQYHAGLMSTYHSWAFFPSRWYKIGVTVPAHHLDKAETL